MPNDNDNGRAHTIGNEAYIESPSPIGKFSVAFEDDGESGYFHALDTSQADQQVLDTLHVYDTTCILSRFKPSSLRLVWSSDGMKAGLIVNGQYQAVFDFEARQGWCRLESPPRQRDWSRKGHAWDERVVDLFD